MKTTTKRVAAALKAERAAKTCINIVRLTMGQDFVRFEIARGCTAVTMHSSKDRPTTIDLNDARERIARLRDAGWAVAAV